MMVSNRNLLFQGAIFRFHVNSRRVSKIAWHTSSHRDVPRLGEESFCHPSFLPCSPCCCAKTRDSEGYFQSEDGSDRQYPLGHEGIYLKSHQIWLRNGDLKNYSTCCCWCCWVGSVYLSEPVILQERLQYVQVLPTKSREILYRSIALPTKKNTFFGVTHLKNLKRTNKVGPLAVISRGPTHVTPLIYRGEITPGQPMSIFGHL